MESKEGGEENIHPLVFKYFSSHGDNNFLKDPSFTLTKKTDRADPTRREECWRGVLKIAILYELNTVDWLIYLLYINLHTIARVHFSRERVFISASSISSLGLYVSDVLILLLYFHHHHHFYYHHYFLYYYHYCYSHY